MNNNELYHHGILGMKWGIRRYQPYPSGSRGGKEVGEAAKKRSYRSTSIRSAIARRQNAKVDKSFKNWKENSQKRADAIELGKKRNEKKIAYENDTRNKDLKREYKQANKEYKKSLRGNTTYRKGQVKKEVGSDISRKYLSKAKQVEKELKKDPNNRDLQKQYERYMNLHDVERAKARRAPEVAANRSRKIASIKRGATMTVKAAATAAVVAGGAKVLHDYGSVNISTDALGAAVRLGKKAIRFI